MEKRSVSLVDKYTLKEGYAFMTGVQALVRLPLVQRQIDMQAGLNTAGYITGYRGSPLGGYDLQLGRNRKLLEESHIKFQPGVSGEHSRQSYVVKESMTVFLEFGMGKAPGLIAPEMF
jgi:indolepyruvate ferredoxin oxidoreductase